MKKSIIYLSIAIFVISIMMLNSVVNSPATKRIPLEDNAIMPYTENVKNTYPNIEKLDVYSLASELRFDYYLTKPLDEKAYDAIVENNYNLVSENNMFEKASPIAGTLAVTFWVGQSKLKYTASHEFKYRQWFVYQDKEFIRSFWSY